MDILALVGDAAGTALRALRGFCSGESKTPFGLERLHSRGEAVTVNQLILQF